MAAVEAKVESYLGNARMDTKHEQNLMLTAVLQKLDRMEGKMRGPAEAGKRNPWEAPEEEQRKRKKDKEEHYGEEGNEGMSVRKGGDEDEKAEQEASEEDEVSI